MVFKVREIEINGVIEKDVFCEAKKFILDINGNTGAIGLHVSAVKEMKAPHYVEIDIDWKGKPQIQKDLQQALLNKLKQAGIEPNK